MEDYRNASAKLGNLKTAYSESLKDRAPYLHAPISGALNYIIHLDNATKKAIYGDNYAFPDDYILEEDAYTIPKPYYDRFDLRMPDETWVERRLRESLKNYLVERSRYQKYLTREELIALDHSLSNLLNPKILRQSIIKTLQDELSILNQVIDYGHYERTKAVTSAFLGEKIPNLQKMVNKQIKNREALFIAESYGMILHEKYAIKKREPIVEQLDKEMQVLIHLYESAYEEPEKLKPYESYE